MASCLSAGFDFSHPLLVFLHFGSFLQVVWGFCFAPEALLSLLSHSLSYHLVAHRVGNLHAVQEQDKISLDDALQCIDADIETADGMKHIRFPNFSIEMETGTGKTYVYIRTALELFR